MGQLVTSTFLSGAGRFDKQTGGTWANQRGAGSSDNNFSSYEIQSDFSPRIQRVLLPNGETANIPDGAVITGVSVALNLRNEGGYTNSKVHLILTNQASPNSRDNADYSSVIFASYGFAIATTTNLDPYTITADSSIYNLINKTGNTLFALICDTDLTNSAPGTNAWVTMTSPVITITYAINSPSQSPSSSLSPSSSPSRSLSPSASASPSASQSPSSSASKSLSPSASQSPSSSASSSVSFSLSPSASGSPSPSTSASASPSIPPSNFSRQASSLLPSTKSDLSIIYTEQEVIDVSSDDGIRVGIEGAANLHLTHQYKIRHSNNFDTMCIEVDLQTTLDPSLSPVYLQIWNKRTQLWETIAVDHESAVDIDFHLTGVVSNNLSDYYDEVHDVNF